MYELIFNFINNYLVNNPEQLAFVGDLTLITIILIYIALVGMLIGTFRFFKNMLKGGNKGRYE